MFLVNDILKFEILLVKGIKCVARTLIYPNEKMVVELAMQC